MNEFDSGIIIIVGLVVIYYYWIRYELKAQLGEFISEVQAKVEDAAKAVELELPCSKAKVHLNEARSLMREVEEFDWRGASSYGDVIAVRRQVLLARNEALAAISAAQSNRKESPGKSMIGVYV